MDRAAAFVQAAFASGSDMTFDQFKTSAGRFWAKTANSETLGSALRIASETGSAIGNRAATTLQSLTAPTTSQKPSDSAAVVNDPTEENYESLAALKPLRKLIVEAGVAINDKKRTLLQRDIPEVLGAVGGAGAGVAAGAGILSAGAASGAVGAAALTSGLSTAGAIVGGGMLAGIGVVATPAVVLGAAGVWAVSRRNKNKLSEAKEVLLQEALRKRDALLSELHATNSANTERVAYLTGLVAQLSAAVANLQADMRPE